MREHLDLTRVWRLQPDVSLLGVSILLSHFWVNVTALATALGVGGLALSLPPKTLSPI